MLPKALYLLFIFLTLVSSAAIEKRKPKVCAKAFKSGDKRNVGKEALIPCKTDADCCPQNTCNLYVRNGKEQMFCTYKVAVQPFGKFPYRQKMDSSDSPCGKIRGPINPTCTPLLPCCNGTHRPNDTFKPKVTAYCAMIPGKNVETGLCYTAVQMDELRGFKNRTRLFS